VVHANQDINIDATSITSVNGLISAGKDAALTSEGDISIASTDVAGGIAAGGNLAITSEEGDINVSGSYLRSGEDMSITAEKGDTTFTASIGTQSDGNSKLHSIDDSIQAGGNLKITGENVTFNAVDVVAGGDAEITATTGDVEFNALSEIVSERSINFTNDGLFSDNSVDKQSITATAVTSSVTSGGNLKVKSANDINIEGASFSAGNGSFEAGKDVNIATAQDVDWEKETTTKNEFVFSASASGGGHSAEMEASTVDGLQTDTSSGYDSVNQYGGGTTSRGKSNGAAVTTPSAGFKAGMQSTTTSTEKSSVKNTNAQFDFANSGKFSADETVDIGGGDFAMEEMNIEANEVASTKYLDESKSTTATKQTFTGIKSESHSVIADVANKYAAMGEEGNDVNIGETTASAVGDATNLIFNDLAGGSLTIGFETTTSGESTYDAQENTTSVNVGSLNLTSKNNTVLSGVDISADNVNVETGGDFTLESAKTYSQSDSYSSTKSGGLTVGAAAGATGAGVGASIDYAQYDEKANASSTTHTNSQMKAGNVNITTGGDMTLEGANIVADKADVNVAGDLNITSTQDTVNTTASSSQASASAGAAVSTSGILPTVSAGYGQGSEYYDSTTVAQQSGITSSGEMNIQVGKDLNLTGGHILSDSENSRVDVDGDINANTLVDSVDQDGLYAGGSGGIDKKGNLMGSGYVTTVDEIHRKEDQKSTLSVGSHTAGGNVNGQLNQDSSNMSEVTEDSYTAGSDISATLGGNVKGKGKPKSKTDNGNNTASATPDTGSQSGSNSSPSNPVHDSPSNVPDTGHASAKDLSTGHSTKKTPANSKDKSTAKPDQAHETPIKVPDVGHSSAKDPSTGNATEKSPSNTDTAHESPTTVPDTGLSSATDPSLGDATEQSKPKRKVWALSPQGNLKGGVNVGTIKNGPKLDSIMEKWKQEYEKRNED
jgi:filamentous hemagglutinin